MKRLLTAIGQRAPLTNEFQLAIQTNFVREELPKGTQILREGQYCRKLYLLEEGIARTFYYEKGKDMTSWLYHEGQFVAAWYSFYGQHASFEYIELLEDSILYSLSYERYNQLLEQFLQFERFARLLTQEQLTFIDLYSKGYQFLSAKEKYTSLLSHFPGVIQRVNLGHIASFLGITQETLSRVRRQV